MIKNNKINHKNNIIKNNIIKNNSKKVNKPM